MKRVIDDIHLRQIVIEEEDTKGDGKTAEEESVIPQNNGLPQVNSLQNNVGDSHQSKFFMESLKTADPVSLLLICYSLAKSSIKKAIEGIKKKDYEMKYEGVVKALQVFDVLMATTEPNEVGKRLISSYLFITQKITEADIKKDISIFEKVIQYIEELERAWKEARIKEAKNRKSAMAQQQQNENRTSQEEKR